MATKEELQIMIDNRTTEIAQYDANISLYDSLCNSLDADGVWDEDLKEFKGMDAQAAARVCPFDKIQRLSELQRYDLYYGLRNTETIERNKAQDFLTFLQAQIALLP